MDKLTHLPLTDEQRRVAHDGLQLHEALIAAEAKATHYRGSYSWKTVNGSDYLYRSLRSGLWKSVGPRSPETETIIDRFRSEKAAVTARVEALRERMRLQAKYATANRLGRLPTPAARVIRAFHAAEYDFRVIGTQAMYVYEMMAGVQLVRDITATTDVDVMFDGRKHLRLMSSASDSDPSLLDVLRRADATYERIATYRVVNSTGFMVDVVAPAWSPLQDNPHFDHSDTDLTPTEIQGLEWLANAPAMKGTAFTMNGNPVTFEVPDPRFFAVHKVYVARAPTRDAIKVQRDLAQAHVVAEIVQEHLPWLRFDDPSLRVFPRSVLEEAQEELGITIGPGLDHAASPS